MAALTGKNLYLVFGTTVLDSDYRSFDPGDSIDVVDQSAGADTARTYLTTLKDGTASLTIVDQASGTVIWTALAPGSSATLAWGEEGTAAGKQKHSVWAIVTSRDKSMAYDDLITIDAAFQYSQATGVTDGTY